MDIWISIAGSVASIGGAIWALMQAYRSRSFAEQAKTIIDELVERRKVIEVSNIYSETKRILRVVSKVGPTATKSSMKTVRSHEIAREIERYTSFLNEQSEHFTQNLNNEAKKLCENIKLDIEALAEANNFEARKEAGKKIYYIIDDFLPLVKKMLDEKNERHSVRHLAENDS